MIRFCLGSLVGLRLMSGIFVEVEIGGMVIIMLSEGELSRQAWFLDVGEFLVGDNWGSSESLLEAESCLLISLRKSRSLLWWCVCFD